MAPPTPQRGGVLLASLVFLLLLTLLGLASMQSSLLNERMSGNMRDLSLAFNAAESALREGEAWVDGLAREPLPSGWPCTTPPCLVYGPDEVPDPRGLSPDQWTGTALTRELGAPGVTDLPEVAEDPRYIVEFVRFIPDSLEVGRGPRTGASVYRITARGTGGNTGAQVIVQSTYLRPSRR